MPKLSEKPSDYVLREQLARDITARLHDQCVFVAERFVRDALPDDLTLRVPVRGKAKAHLLDLYDALGLGWGDDPFTHIQALTHAFESPILRDIANERVAQRIKYDDAHDDAHTRGELASTAIAHVLCALGHDWETVAPYLAWPDALPNDDARLNPRFLLVRAAALLIAEAERVERVERAKQPKQPRPTALTINGVYYERTSAGWSSAPTTDYTGVARSVDAETSTLLDYIATMRDERGGV